MVVDESNQQQICAGNSNAKRVEAESAVIADKSAHFDVTDALTGVILHSQVMLINIQLQRNI